MPKIQKKKTSLKESLKQHQARQQVAKRQAEGREKAYVRKDVMSANQKKVKRVVAGVVEDGKGKGKVVIPFGKDDKLLLIGEGNFSYALSLILHHNHPSTNLVATAHDDRSTCFMKYPGPGEAEENVRKLEDAGVRVLFGVDAGKLTAIKELRGLSEAVGGWDKVIWNFPHAGAGITDQDRNILSNQQLILGFLRSAPSVLCRGISLAPSHLSPNKKNKKKGKESDDLSEDEDDNAHTGSGSGPASARGRKQGTVLITLKDSIPYTLWTVPALAKNPPISQGSTTAQPRYWLHQSFGFRPDAYPGYEHRRTAGSGPIRSQANPSEEPQPAQRKDQISRTWEFALREEEAEKDPLGLGYTRDSGWGQRN